MTLITRVAVAMASVTFTNEDVINSENITPTGLHISNSPKESDRSSHQ